MFSKPRSRIFQLFNRSSASSDKGAGAGLAGLRSLWLVALTSVWLGTVCNLALWRELARLPDLSVLHIVEISVAFCLAIIFLINALLSLLAWRWTLKPVITICLFAAAAGSYFMLTYGVVIDKHMIVNTLQTDMRETRDLLSWRLAATVLVLAVLPAVWLWRQKLRPQRALRLIASNAAVFVVSAVMFVLVFLIAFQGIASVMRNHPQVRYLINPLNSFYALGVVAARPLQRDESRILPIGEDAKLGSSYSGQQKPPLLLLVLGETGRSGNFALNGYARPTNPELSKENVASQRNAWSCGTSTAASVPCMFSSLGRNDFDSRPANSEGMLDVIKRAGLAVLWIDNQAGCKGACDRVASVNTANLHLPDICPNDECFDEVMLRDLDARIAALPEEARQKGVVIVMHQMGSHGPAYYQRSPEAFKKFSPECKSNELQTCSREDLVNAYDNSIVYTDHVLASSIRWLKQQQDRASTAMIYVADHGESLGENNLYLHGMPYSVAPDVQKHVPWITWLSPQFEARSGITTACLKSQLDLKVSHDNYFHSVLGILDIQTSVHQPGLDMYAACAKAT